MKTRTFLSVIMMAAFVGLMTGCSDSDDEAEATPTPTATAAPTASPTPISFSQVSAGGNYHYQGTEDVAAHTCALSTDGTLWCWGNNGFGQLGTGNYLSTSSPTQVGTESDWLVVQAGGTRTCGIRGTAGKGTLWCWGANRKYGEVDNGNQIWGLLGLGNTYDSVDTVNAPTQVGTSSDWTQLGMANHHSCAIRDSGTQRTLWCWGSDSQGALGDGNSFSEDVTNEPTQEGDGVNGAFIDWAFVAGGKLGYENNATCGIRDDGAGSREIWCMGFGIQGGPSGGDVAVQLGSDTDWEMISWASWSDTCAIKTDGTLWCASDNRHGQAGQGDFTTMTYLSLTQVGTDTTWTDVSVARSSVCGVNNGALYCWGRDHTGELGLGTDPSANTECDQANHGGYVQSWDCNAPVLVDDAQTWVATTGGRSQKCGLTDSNEVYCWGNNFDGAVGAPDGGPIVYTPTKVE